MLNKSKKLIPFILPALSMLVPTAVSAAQLVPTGGQGFPGADILDVMRNIIRFILIVAFVIAFIMLIVGGIRWMLAGGDEKAVEKARGTITSALIGMVVVLVAFALIKLVETFFGVSIIKTGAVVLPDVTTP